MFLFNLEVKFSSLSLIVFTYCCYPFVFSYYLCLYLIQKKYNFYCFLSKPPTDNPEMETSQGRLFIPGLYSSDTPKNLPLGKNIRLQAEVTDSGEYILL